MKIIRMNRPTPISASRIILPIALAGTWCAPGIREGGGDLPLWKRFHGPEGVRQAGMPAGANACDRQTGRPYVSCSSFLTSWRYGTGRRGDRHRTGAEAQSLPPPDAKGSGWVDEPPIIKFRLVVATLPSSHSLQKPGASAGVATTRHVRPQAASPTGRRA